MLAATKQTIIKIITNFLVAILQLVERSLSLFVRKNRTQVLLCLQNGHQLSGNTKAFLDHYRRSQKPSFELLMLCRGTKTHQRLSALYPELKVVDSYSIAGFLAFIRSGVILISHGVFDYFPLKKLNNQTIINLWHGIPVKAVGEIHGKTIKDFQYMVVSSEFEAKLMKPAFELSDKQLLILGMPKMDAVFAAANTPIAEPKTILYLPTFRENNAAKYFEFEDADLNELNNYFEENHLHVIIKPHPNDLIYPRDPRFDSLSAITLVTDRATDLSTLLSTCWCVITDYSGAYFDAVAIDKPIIFIPYDYDDYTVDRGFMYDYFENTPGPKVSSQKELTEHINALLSGEDSYKSDREKIRDRFFKYKDARASERLTAFIEKLLAAIPA